MNKMNNDSNSYILCKHTVGNLLTTHTSFFSTFNDVYECIINYFKFIKSDEFLKSYNEYLNGLIVKNGHNMLFSKDYVISFGHDDIRYELYRTDKNSNYALVMFISEMNLIGSVKGFDTRDDALEQIKKEFKERFNSDVVINDSNPNLIQYEDIIFGMIFRCI